MAEVKLTGNCLKGSRPMLSFDLAFDAQPHLVLLKELFTQVPGESSYPAAPPSCEPA